MYKNRKSNLVCTEPERPPRTRASPVPLFPFQGWTKGVLQNSINSNRMNTIRLLVNITSENNCDHSRQKNDSSHLYPTSASFFSSILHLIMSRQICAQQDSFCQTLRKLHESRWLRKTTRFLPGYKHQPSAGLRSAISFST